MKMTRRVHQSQMNYERTQTGYTAHGKHMLSRPSPPGNVRKL